VCNLLCRWLVDLSSTCAQSCSGICSTTAATGLVTRTPIEQSQPAFSRRANTFVFQNPESARRSLTPVAPARAILAISSSVVAVRSSSFHLLALMHGDGLRENQLRVRLLDPAVHRCGRPCGDEGRVTLAPVVVGTKKT